ncbi:MAG: hypothetical protein Q4B13_00800 [Lautropia sp.]|nr:hypothetical protein [Lautropia sp.]
MNDNIAALIVLLSIMMAWAVVWCSIASRRISRGGNVFIAHLIGATAGIGAAFGALCLSAGCLVPSKKDPSINLTMGIIGGLILGAYLILLWWPHRASGKPSSRPAAAAEQPGSPPPEAACPVPAPRPTMPGQPGILLLPAPAQKPVSTSTALVLVTQTTPHPRPSLWRPATWRIKSEAFHERWIGPLQARWRPIKDRLNIRLQAWQEKRLARKEAQRLEKMNRRPWRERLGMPLDDFIEYRAERHLTAWLILAFIAARAFLFHAAGMTTDKPFVDILLDGIFVLLALIVTLAVSILLSATVCIFVIGICLVPLAILSILVEAWVRIRFDKPYSPPLTPVASKEPDDLDDDIHDTYDNYRPYASYSHDRYCHDTSNHHGACHSYHACRCNEAEPRKSSSSDSLFNLALGIWIGSHWD